MKRIFTLITAMLLVCLMIFAVTSCGEAEKVKIGENGNWFIGSTDTGVKAAGTNVTIGENGNWFVDSTDTGVKAAGTNATIGENGNWYLNGVDSGKKAVGTDAEKVNIGENGNWFIGTVDTGVKAVTGKYVVDVATTTELDQKYGKQYAVTVITYSDGTTETQKNEIPEQIENLMWVGETAFYAGYTPALRIKAVTTSYDYITVKVTDDMYIGAKPDFNTPGTYSVMIVYGGQSIVQNIEVLDATGVSIEDMYISDSNIRRGTPLSEVAVRVNFNEGFNYCVWLSDCSELGVIDFNTVKDYFEFDATYKGYSGTLSAEVYDPEVNNIRGTSAYIDHSLAVIPHNADANTVKAFFEQHLIGEYKDVYLYEDMYGTDSIPFTVTEDMLDLSGLDTSKLGQQVVKLTVNIEGVGSYTENIYLSVKADLTNATLVKTYTNAVLASMLGDIAVYDNGVAVLGGGESQGNYTISGNVLSIVTSGMTMYFTVDDTNNTYAVYVPAGEPSATYTNADEHMQVKVYSDYVVVCMYSAAEGPQPEMSMPVYSMSISALQNNTIDFMGMKIVLNSDGTLELTY